MFKGNKFLGEWIIPSFKFQFDKNAIWILSPHKINPRWDKTNTIASSALVWPTYATGCGLKMVS